jgi:hypothetical protein
MKFVLADGSTVIVEREKLLPGSKLISQWDSKYRDHDKLTTFSPELTVKMIDFILTGHITDGTRDFYEILEFYDALEYDYVSMGLTHGNFPEGWLDFTQEETWIRNRFYHPEFKWLQEDNFYGLIRIDEDAFKQLISAIDGKFDMYTSAKSHLLKARGSTFGEKRVPASLEEWKERIFIDLSRLRRVSNIVVAGGSLISTLTDAPVGDYDLFIHGLHLDNQEAHNSKLMEVISGMGRDYSLVRSANAVTINSSTKVQIILRGYKTIAEVLYGFDLDCSGICYDHVSNEIYVTPRAWFALTTFCNVVNLTLTGPTYGYRLHKYRQRGFNIFVPGMDKEYINRKGVRGMRRFVNDTIPKLTSTIVDDLPDDICARYRRRGRSNRSKCTDENKKTILNGLLMNNLKSNFHGLSYLLLMDRLDYHHPQLGDYDIPIEEVGIGSTRLPVRKIEESGSPKYYGYADENENSYKRTGYGFLIFTKHDRDDLPNAPRMPVTYYDYETFFNIPVEVMDGLDLKISRKLKWTTNDFGDQLTTTFNRTIYRTVNNWLDGVLYKTDSDPRNDILNLYLTISKMYLGELVDPDMAHRVNELIGGRDLFSGEVFVDLVTNILSIPNVDDRLGVVSEHVYPDMGITKERTSESKESIPKPPPLKPINHPGAKYHDAPHGAGPPPPGPWAWAVAMPPFPPMPVIPAYVPPPPFVVPRLQPIYAPAPASRIPMPNPRIPMPIPIPAPAPRIPIPVPAPMRIPVPRPVIASRPLSGSSSQIVRSSSPPLKISTPIIPPVLPPSFGRFAEGSSRPVSPPQTQRPIGSSMYAAMQSTPVPVSRPSSAGPSVPRPSSAGPSVPRPVIASPAGPSVQSIRQLGPPSVIKPVTHAMPASRK